MIIGPILQGGLKMIAEEEKDWEVLKCIRKDATGDLSRRLSSLMDDDSMWDEIVAPELTELFSDQVNFVDEKIMEAWRKSEDSSEEEGEIVILKEEADMWYGALNQARLSMEARYRLGPREEREIEEVSDEEVKSAHYREEFYVTVQSLLMQYAMD